MKNVQFQIQTAIAQIACHELDGLIACVNSSGKEADEKTCVVMLTKTNDELRQLSGILRNHIIPADIRQDGSFYASKAFCDFYAMISSFFSVKNRNTYSSIC